MSLHSTAFDYLQPTQEQIEQMRKMRDAAKVYADHLEYYLPEGPDKTYCLRLLRTVAMWANIAITKQPDGAPRI